MEVVFVINILTITQVSILLKKSGKERHNVVFIKCHYITGVPPSLWSLSDSYSGFMMLSFLDNDMSHFLQRPQNILDAPLGLPKIYFMEYFWRLKNFWYYPSSQSSVLLCWLCKKIHYQCEKGCSRESEQSRVQFPTVPTVLSICTFAAHVVFFDNRGKNTQRNILSMINNVCLVLHLF